MRTHLLLLCPIVVASLATFSDIVFASEAYPSAAIGAPRVPRFSTNYMDLSVQPGADFYKYADGSWVKSNPVPSDKSRWGGFAELQERNWFLIHEILDEALSTPQPAGAPAGKVADFFRSAMDTNRLEQAPVQTH